MTNKSQQKTEDTQNQRYQRTGKTRNIGSRKMERPYIRPEPRAVDIRREVSEVVEEAPLYIDPPHLLFTDYTPNSDHAILTSVCWLLAKRPEGV